MKTAAVYIRVSTEDQAEFSPGAQKRALLDYAGKNGYTIAPGHIFVDEGISGRTAEKRPAFMEMIACAKMNPRPFDAILVHKFDRFARNREDSVVYKSLLRKECGVKVISITEEFEDDKFSIILEAMLEAMAEYYSLNLSDEVKKGMFEKARRGEHIGKAPYGYELVSGQLVKIPYEFQVIQDIFQLFLYGNHSPAAIAGYLNENSVKSKNGGKWATATIAYLLGNPVYCGQVRYNYRQGGVGKPNPPEEWILAQSGHEPAISEDDHRKAVEKLTLPINTYSVQGGRQKLRSWLQHLCVCDRCGSVLTVSSTCGGKYLFFRCPGGNKGACSMKATLSAGKLEVLALAALEKYSQDLVNNLPPDHITCKTQRDLLAQSMKEIDVKLALAKKAYLNRVDTLAEYNTLKTKLLAEKKSFEMQLKQWNHSFSNKNPEKFNCNYNDYIPKLQDKALSPAEKNAAARQFIHTIQVDLINKTLRIIYSP